MLLSFVARIVEGLPDAVGKPGWKHDSQRQHTAFTLDFWYLGTSRENVEREMANATFIGSGRVEMPILFKKVLNIGSFGVNGDIVEAKQFLGWVEVFSGLEGEYLQYASQALMP